MLWVLAIFVVGAGLGFCLGRRRSGNVKVVQPQPARPREPDSPYFSRGKLLSQEERGFLIALESALKGELRILAKVRMEDLVEVRGLTGRARLSANNRIKSRYVDFALCHPKSFKLRAVVDFDDGSEKSARVIEGEKFKRTCFRSTGIHYLRFKGIEDISAERVREWVAEMQILQETEADLLPRSEPGNEEKPFSRIGDWVAAFDFRDRPKPRLLDRALERKEQKLTATAAELEPKPKESASDPSLN